jgi:hypothetical protein
VEWSVNCLGKETIPIAGRMSAKLLVAHIKIKLKNLMDFIGWISLGRLVEGNTPNQRRNQRQLPGGQAMGASLYNRDTTKKPSEKSMRLRFLPVKIHSKLNANAVFS